MSEWREVTLGDVCMQVTSGGTPRRSRPEYYELGTGGHAWVKSSELRDDYVRTTTERISDLGLRTSAAKLIPANSVLVAMYGATAGRVGFLAIEATVNQAVCALIPDPSKSHPLFLFHALRHRYTELAGKAAGAAQQNLSAGVVRTFRLSVPAVQAQRRIAAILAAFDDLIETNERRIELLENLARSLYREWLVRFRFPGYDDAPGAEPNAGATTGQSRLRRLDEVASIVMGQSPKSEFYNDVGDGLPFHQGVADFGPLIPRHRKFCTIERRLAKAVDVLCSVRAPVGRLILADQPLVLGRGLAGIRRLDDRQALLFEQLRAGMGEEDSLGGGTIYKAISKDELASVPMLEPDPVTAERFEAAARPWLNQRVELTLLNRRLALTRDLLLPRLVTGRLDVSDVDLGDLLPAEAA